jgi:hypothetical protein
LPAILRSRVALFAFVGVFLVPLALSSLRGLTHILVCAEEAGTPFTLAVPNEGRQHLTSSARMARGHQEGICGGLSLDLAARDAGHGKVAVVVPITNGSNFGWQGTVKLELGSTSLPVRIGSIPPGHTRSDKLTLRLPPGTHELNGSLLIGP